MLTCRWGSEEESFKILDEDSLKEKIKFDEEDLKCRMDSLQLVLNSLEAAMLDLMAYYRKLYKLVIKERSMEDVSHLRLQDQPVLNLKRKKEKPMHKKIMEKAAKALKKDASHYAKAAKSAKRKVKKKHEKVERKEALSAAKDLKKRARVAHEY